MRKVLIILILLVSGLVTVGCGTGSQHGYVVPRGESAANEVLVNNSGIEEIGDIIGNYTVSGPISKHGERVKIFPVNISIVRVSYPGDSSHNSYANESGKFNVVTARDLEQQGHFQKISDLEGVKSIAPINLLMTPDKIESISDLRVAGSKLNTDMLLVYTLESSFKTKTTDIGPLAAVTLGFTPNRMEYVTSTAAATLVDVNSGYIYGTFEGSWSTNHNASIWSEGEVKNNLKIETEQKAYDILMNTIYKVWPEILKNNG